jgi:ATP-dependent helicase/nuclease subunit B
LENYCLAYGIKGSDWSQKGDWIFGDGENPLFDLNRVNQIRQKAIEPLLRLKERLCPPGGTAGKISPELFTKILFDFLDEQLFNQKIGRLIDQAYQQGDFALADEHRQVFDALLDVFDELCEAFAGTQISCADYLSLITAAFSQMTLALIPPTLDQVLVGSIERSRHPDIKAAFLIGLTGKDFPSPVLSSGVISDQDRLTAESAGFQLAPTSFKILSESQYLAYIAFTRASEFLFLSYPSQDRKGRPVVRSRFIDDIEALFENFKPVILNQPDTFEAVPGQIKGIYTAGELKDFLCSRAGSDRTIFSLLDCLSEDSRLAHAGALARAAIEYDNVARLDKPVVKEFFTGSLDCSASRLSTFAECPDRFFARYILELRERKEFKFEPLDLGNLYHRVLDSIFKFLKAQGISFETVGDDRLVEILEKIVAEIIERDSYVKGFCRHSQHNMFILISACSILQDCILSVSRMIGAGRFRPRFTEAAFGNPDDLIGRYKILLKNGRSISLKGKIDRLDLARLDNGDAAVVFDYKRKSRSFSWSHLFYGLDLQLVIYMLAVRNWGRKQSVKCDIAGAFYIPVETAAKFFSSDESQNIELVLGRKATGLFNGSFADYLEENVIKRSRFYNFYVKDGLPYGYYSIYGALKPDDFDKVLKFAEKKVIELALQILSGKIDITPYRLGSEIACSFCEYKSVCRFDWQINDYNSLLTRAKQDVMDLAMPNCIDGV